MPRKTEVAESIRSLREDWRYDPAVQRRIDRAMEAFRDYAQKRARHVSLSHAPASEYDSVAVRAADRERTAAHNEAIRAAVSLNDLCALEGREPVAPIAPEGFDPFSLKSHRRAVAVFVAEALELDQDEVDALDL